MRGVTLIVALLVAIVGFTPEARACANCRDTQGTLLGVLPDGTVAVLEALSSGEADGSFWSLRTYRGSREACFLDVNELVDEATIGVTGERGCEAVLNLDGGGVREGERRIYRRKKFERGWAHRKLARDATPLVATAVPAGIGFVPMPEDNSGTTHQPITIDGVRVGTVAAQASWSVTAFAFPDQSGVFLRLTSIMPHSGQWVGSSSHCIDYFDSYVPLDNATIARARARAVSRAVNGKRSR